MEKPSVNTKLLAWVSIMFLLGSLYFNWSLQRKNKQLQEYRDNSLERLKAEKDSIIKSRELRIDSLLLDNEAKDKVILDAKEEYDSLQTVKDSIKVVYKYKYKQMDSYTSKDIENYWKNEFK